MKNLTNQKTRGVTLVEIAIVLVIIGLLLGGVLKGQELINNAKVRAIADRQSSLKVAWFSFIDRYQALPADYLLAHRYIPGATTDTGVTGDGIIIEHESPVVFQQLTAAGYLRCSQCSANQTAAPTGANSLVNNYGGVMAVFHDSTTYAAVGGAGSDVSILMVHTGGRIPSNIIGEVDRKIDDGLSNTGDFVFSKYDAGGTTNEPKVTLCTTNNSGSEGDLAESTQLDWRWQNLAPPIVANCGAAVRI